MTDPDIYRRLAALEAWQNEMASVELPSIPDWTAPTLLNSWVNYGGGYNDAGYYKTSKRVYLRGLIKDGVTTAATIFFTLPSGYRPASYHAFACASNNAYGQAHVDTNGNVFIIVGSATWFSLDGISFRAA